MAFEATLAVLLDTADLASSVPSRARTRFCDGAGASSVIPSSLSQDTCAPRISLGVVDNDAKG
jgi:hypothetical protein